MDGAHRQRLGHGAAAPAPPAALGVLPPAAAAHKSSIALRAMRLRIRIMIRIALRAIRKPTKIMIFREF